MEIAAGIRTFEKFNYINTVNALAGGDITKWSLILAMPYERVLTKLLCRALMVILKALSCIICRF